MTSIVAHGVFTVSLAFDRLTPADLPSRTTLFAHGSFARRHCGVVTRSPASRRSSPATALPSRINREDRAPRAYSSRPARPRRHAAKSGASLEVSRPLQHTSAASRARSEGGRPPDLSRSGVSRSPLARASCVTDLRRRSLRPCGFPLYQRGRAASPDPADAFGSSPAIPHSATSLACDAR